MAFRNEALIALFARERSGSCVGAEMSSKVTTLSEEFVALEEGTFECAFTAFLPFKFNELNNAILTLFLSSL